MEILGYIFALLIGISLGLVGGGGSILTVPVMVYLFGIEPILATAYSLFIVGTSSLVGTFEYIKKGLLDYKTAILFAVPSFISVFVTRKFFLPLLPENVNASFESSEVKIIIISIVIFTITLLTTYFILRSSLKMAGKGYFKVFLLLFPAIMMVFMMRQFFVPSLPDNLFTLGSVSISKNTGIMILFSIVMLIASISMVRKKKETVSAPKQRSKIYRGTLITLEGVVVGSVTGLIGAGGGFLIIPALVVLAKLPMKMAVGTSLLIISVKSLIGFLGDLSYQTMDWTFLLSFSGLSIVGIFLGARLSDKIPGDRLKTGFGWFILVMATFILLKQFV